MNLLPQEDQNKIKKDRAFRFLAVFGVGILVVQLISLVLLLPTYLFLVSQSLELGRQLDLDRQSAELYRAENIESSIKGLNKKMGALQENEKLLRDPSISIRSVIDEKLNNIKLNSFIYRKGKTAGEMDTLSLDGYSNTREILLEFIDVLEDDALFDVVESPVSNILSKDEVEFSLILHLSEL